MTANISNTIDSLELASGTDGALATVSTSELGAVTGGYNGAPNPNWTKKDYNDFCNNRPYSIDCRWRSWGLENPGRDG